MQPRPMADTSRPLLPSLRFCIVLSPWVTGGRSAPCALVRAERPGHAAFVSRPDQGSALLFVRRGAEAEARAHAAETDSRDFQIAVSKVPLLHFDFSSEYF